MQISDPVTSSERVSFAIAAYNAARAEIIERLKIREDLIKVYLIGCLTFAGGSFATADNLRAYYLCLVAPVVSLPLAIMVRKHNIANEVLAEFLCGSLGTEMERLAIPTWDSYIQIAKQRDDSKSTWTTAGSLFGIHFLPACSMLIAWWRAAMDFTIDEHMVLGSLALTTFLATIGACISYDALGERKRMRAKRT